MPIITENQTVKAKIFITGDCLNLEFPEDPSHALAEQVVLDLPQRSIGVIVANSLHHAGDFPNGLIEADVKLLTRARLSAKGEWGRDIELYAPIRVLS